MQYNKKIITILITLAILLQHEVVFSQSVDELKKNIENHSEKIKQLDEEIKKYEKQIENTGAEAKTLQGAINTLDVSQKKITTEIKKTETNIDKTNLVIQDLGNEIVSIQSKIGSNTEAIKRSINELYQADDTTLIENILSDKSLADILDQYETINRFQDSIRTKTVELESYQTDLSVKKNATEGEKKKLVSLKSELGDQNQVLSNTKKEKSTLLSATKNKEAEYKKILADRQAQKEKFEKELFDFESALKRAIDPNSFPTGKKGILAYPLDSIFVTQAFGRTVDAKRLYVSGTHNGVDFRASRGTPIKSALDGVVLGTGNTDAQSGCYSYGKWVLIKHPNGLSSLYAHLDLIKVSAGQSVKTSEIIGYSGQTGYATGPHLHFTLYASQGVEIQRYSSSKNCKNVDIPIASSNAYLDPMLYF